MTASLKDLKVGDKVIIPRYPRNGERVGEEFTITRVGRKLVYVTSHNQEAGFYMEDGRERAEYAIRTMYLPAEWYREERKTKALSRLRNEYQIMRNGYSHVDISTEAWEAVLAVLDHYTQEPDQ